MRRNKKNGAGIVFWGILIVAAVILLLVQSILDRGTAERESLSKNEQTDIYNGQTDTGELSTEQISELTPEQMAEMKNVSGKGFKIVLDAGHGAVDPGKVSADGVIEKDINLEIVRYLRKYLSALEFEVVLTRESDEPLYSENATHKKAEDMRARLKIIEEAKPYIVVSVHQNSFSQTSSHGAQVFYYSTSADGKRLAEILQETMRNKLDPDNRREAKANTSYYLLKKVPCPIVIVESGFLSNPQEAEKLATAEYQKKIAWAICVGIAEYCQSGRTE